MLKMESTSYLEIFPIQGSITLPTKSMQEIVTSMATKVTQFIIKSSKNSKQSAVLSQSFSDTDAAYNDMIQSSEVILKSLKHMIKVINETVVLNYNDDEIISEETDIAAQNLLVTGENLRMCCQVLASTNGDVIDSSYNLDLVANVSKLFQCMVVMLLCVDNAEVRLLIELSTSVTTELSQLCSSKDMEELCEKFRFFGTAVYQFHSRASQRRDDLLSAVNQAKLTRALTTLQRSMPVLATALSFAIKYPRNDEATSAKLFAIKQVEDTVSEIVSIIKIRSNEKDLMTDTNIGVFISHLQSIENVLDLENRHNLVNLKLETLVQSMIQHLMSMSSYVSHCAPEQSRKSTHLVRESQKLLELVSIVVRISPSEANFHLNDGDNQLSNADNSSRYDSVCRAVRGKLKNIESCVRFLVCALFTHTFTITDQPLKNLLTTFEYSLRNPAPSAFTRRDSAVAAFQSHANEVVQIGRFIEISCSDPDIYRGFDSCLGNFASISSEIAQTCSGENRVGFETAEEMLEHARNLTGAWGQVFRNLLRHCVLSLDLATLTDDVEKNIISDLEKCHEDVVNFDDSALSGHVISATEKARLLAEIANHVIDVNTDPLFRNGVLTHVMKLKEATTHAVASGNLLIEDTARLTTQEAFLASASHLKSKVRDVCSALFSSKNHPPITSEERKGVRDAADPDKVNGMILEMRKLSDKLTSLGFEPGVPSSKFNVDPTREKSDSKSMTDVVDEMFATSGSAVVVEPIEEKLREEIDANDDVMTPDLTDGLVEACFQTEKADRMEVCLHEMREITRFLTEACVEGEPCLRTRRIPSIAESEAETNKSASEEALEMKGSLRESFNLIEGYIVNEKDPDRHLVESLCKSWENSYRGLKSCLDASLKVYLVSLRRYVLTRRKTGVARDPTHSASPSFDLNPSHEGVAVMKRTNETLSILLCDVITFFKRELKGVGDKSKSPLLTRLDVLLSRSKKVTSDLRSELKEMLNNLPKLSENHPDYSHARAIYCAAKLCALFSLIDIVLQLVLGVRNLDLSLEHFTSRDQDYDHMIEYSDQIHMLCQSALDRISSSLENENLHPKMAAKLKKLKNKVDLTQESISDVVAFIIKKKSTTPLLNQHGHLVFHLFFLHRRFLLDVSRTFLVTKALNQIREPEAAEKKSKGEVRFEIPLSVPVNEKDDGAQYTGPGDNLQFSPSYAERLAALTNQRKEREKELLHLLSDVDAKASETPGISSYVTNSQDGVDDAMRC